MFVDSCYQSMEEIIQMTHSSRFARVGVTDYYLIFYIQHFVYSTKSRTIALKLSVRKLYVVASAEPAITITQYIQPCSNNLI